jgi:hypothetical protein
MLMKLSTGVLEFLPNTTTYKSLADPPFDHNKIKEFAVFDSKIFSVSEDS